VLLAAAGPAGADQVVLAPAADTTIYRNAALPTEPYSNGIGDGLFVGRTSNNADVTQRSIIRFNLSAIPAGSIVTAAELTFSVISGGTGLTSAPVRLQKAAESWGTGASNSFGGSGASSQANDASWFHRFYPGTLWATVGGSYSATVSATVNVPRTQGSVVRFNTAGVVADVQAWVNNPATNFGWFVLGNETTRGSARRLASSEHVTASIRPSLRVTFTPPPQCSGDLNQDGNVDQDDVAYLVNVIGGGTNPAGANPDFNSDGNADQDDVAALINVVAGGPCP
jgi:hypothetical protein